MEKIDDGGAAFPQGRDEGTSDSGFPIIEILGGLTKREYFACEAMKGLCANPDIDQNVESITRWSIEHANALIAALKK